MRGLPLLVPALLLAALIALAGCASTPRPVAAGGEELLKGNYQAGAHDYYTVDGHPVICQTTGYITRSVTTCF